MEINLVRKIAWSFHRSTGIEFEELFSEASLAWMEAENSGKYNPDKAKFTTYAYQCIISHLRNYLKKQYHDTYLYEPIKPDPFVEISFRERIEKLSDEAKTICRQIFSAPQEYLEYSPKKARGKLKNELREARYSWNQIWSSFREIKDLINEREVEYA